MATRFCSYYGPTLVDGLWDDGAWRARRVTRRGEVEGVGFSTAIRTLWVAPLRQSLVPNRCSTTRHDRRAERRPNGKRVVQRMCEKTQKCARCGKMFIASENKAGSCLFHGDVLGNVMQLSMYEDHHFDDAALDGVKGPRYGKRWACCQDTDADAPPCKSGFHVTYDCDAARWAMGIEFAVK